MKTRASLRLLRLVRQLHRTLGSGFALLLAVWFASGAVMTFARYPEYSESERLRDAAPIEPGSAPSLPPELADFIAAGGLETGIRVRLASLEQQLTWTVENLAGVRRAWRASAPWQVTPLDEARARREAERRMGARSTRAALILEADQWTIGRSAPGDFPLYRIAFDDAAGSEVYVAASSGEILQQSTRVERALAWLGAIPHWIYPCSLRRHRELWNASVLCLAGFGLVVSCSGLFVGIQAALARRGAQPSVLQARRQNAYLRWHQRIGLGFGAFVSTWLFSGALSLAPFDWSGGGPSPAQLQRIYASGALSSPLPIAEALARCGRDLAVKELEIAGFAGTLLAVCSDANGQTRLVDLLEPSVSARPGLALERLRALGSALASEPGAFELELRKAPDAYYYPTHSDPPIANPYVWLSLHDAERTAFYIDPARASLVGHFTARKRLERWLYHGLHNLDFAPLYAQRGLWRSVMLAAMLAGFTLALLGLLMRARRSRRR
jgi:hypothetical protein